MKQIESGRMDKEILAVKEKYAPRISEIDATITLAAQQLEAQAATAQDVEILRRLD